MHNTPQWIVTKRIPQADGKIKKVPIDWRSATYVDAHNPKYWTSHGVALSCSQAFGPQYGVGFVFTERDPYFFIDLDGVRDTEGKLTPYAAQVVKEFHGCYLETSVSGRGIHIIGRYDGPEPPHWTRHKDFPGELYTSKRFCDVTGTLASGDGEAIRTVALRNLIARHPAPAAEPGQNDAEWTTGPCPEWRGPTDDAQLIERALRSRSAASAFGGKAGFADLWEGNVPVLAATYPPGNMHDAYNASSADAALAAHLMFWTGRDCERVERLMRQSALRRAKWDDRDDYLRGRTIMHALRHSRDVLQDEPPAPGPGGNGLEMGREWVGNGATPMQTDIVGQTLLGVEQQKAHFAGCVYVTNLNEVFTPTEGLLDRPRFEAHFGRRTFVMDRANEKTTPEAWKAFLQSQALAPPIASTSCFRPALPSGAVVEENGRARVNVYREIKTRRAQGSAAPFLTHLRKLLPDERDREILLSYMCAVVQHKGTKFQWAPLLQGTEGNGKTVLTYCLIEALGIDHCHMARPNEISEKFNGWIFNRIFIGVEDIYVPGEKRELIEILKPMITGRYQEMRVMNKDQITLEVCANFLFNSNHLDAVQKTRNDRRFAIFFTAQQGRDDLERDGMDGAYFPELYDWLQNRSGHAIVSDLLYTRAICPEFNPAGVCVRAPDTSSTPQAIAAGMGRAEQEIVEAVAQGRPGFCGGWISSVMLTLLFRELGIRSPQNTRRQMLEALGYVHHPGLPDGRVFNPVQPDGSKPRLFIKRGHEAARLVGGEAARAYSEAQMPKTTPA